MAGASRRVLARVLTSLLAIAVLFPAAATIASGEIGAGSRLAVQTQTQMLDREGGGYVTWEISGPVVVDVRTNIDRTMGDGDGNVSSAEGMVYKGGIDSLLENYVSYGCARINRMDLLTKKIEQDTEGLLGSVNSSSPIKIRYYFNADLRPEGVTANFGDTTIPKAVFGALGGDRKNLTFAGTLEWRHTEIMVGLSSFSQVAMQRGSLSRFRAPGVEVLWYQVTLQGNETSHDQVRFDTFNVVQCPAELFVVMCIFGVLTIWFPRHYMKRNKMRKLRWLHYLALMMAICLLLVFFAGLDGALVWALSPLFAALSWALSWEIYDVKWKGMAKPLLPPVAPRKPLPPATAGEEPPRVSPRPERRGDAGPREFPAPGQVPAEKGHAAGTRRTLRCPKCKATFEVDDSGVRPMPIKCTECGTEGVLRK